MAAPNDHSYLVEEKWSFGTDFVPLMVNVNFRLPWRFSGYHR